MEKQEIENLIKEVSYQVNQSTKQENSGLVSTLLKKIEEKNDKQILMDTLDEYFNRGVEKGKFIDVSRIPLICQDISNIHNRIEKIDDNIVWIVRLIIGAVVLSLLGVIFIHIPTPL